MVKHLCLLMLLVYVTGCVPNKVSREPGATATNGQQKMEAHQEGSGRIPNDEIRATAAKIDASNVKRVVVSHFMTELGSSKDPSVIKLTLDALRSSDRDALVPNEPSWAKDEIGDIDFELADVRTVGFAFCAEDLEEQWNLAVARALERIVPNLEKKWEHQEWLLEE